MTDPDDQRDPARVGRAFAISVGVIGAAALAGLSVWLLNRAADEAQPVADAQIAPPVVERSGEAAPILPRVPFTDITAAAGIDFVHQNGGSPEKLLPETMGSGLAFLDYDDDGDPDLYLVNATYWPEQAAGRTTSAKLYRNDGAGRFTDVTSEAGLDHNLYGFGVAVGDFDNDGWTDLFLANLGNNLLFHNNQGRFEDVTEQAGVRGNPEDWSTGSAFLDIDNDGDLDLFVGNYVTWSRDIDLDIDFQLAGLGRSYGAPNHHEGALSRLYRNDGNGRFTESSRAAGITIVSTHDGRAVGKALGVAPTDIDGDGWLDLLVANDTTRNFLYRNLGNGNYQEVGILEGIAYDREGKATGAMGIDVANYRNDAEIGIAIGNFANEMSSLYVTMEGQGPLVDEAILEGLGPDSRLALTFAVLFFDADLDGRLDLFQANGHLENEINRVQASQTYAQPAQLFWNCGDACPQRLQLLDTTTDLAQPLVARGAAYADIDADGDLDLAIAQNGRRAVLLRNDQQLGHHWLRLSLIGKASNRNAIGASVELTANGITQRRMVMPSRGYLSQVELPLTFGLGDANSVTSLHVTWPGGQRQNVVVPGIDRLVVVHEE